MQMKTNDWILKELNHSKEANRMTEEGPAPIENKSLRTS